MVDGVEVTLAVVLIGVVDVELLACSPAFPYKKKLAKSPKKKSEKSKIHLFFLFFEISWKKKCQKSHTALAGDSLPSAAACLFASLGLGFANFTST